MSDWQVRRRSPWKRRTGYVLLMIAAGLVAFVSIANVAYYGSLPADLPCRNCSGEARSVGVNGFDLFYRELGAGQEHAPIVILHGGPGHSSQSLKQSFDVLADQYRVIYYDQRGSGNSQIVPDSRAYTIDALVEELEALRRDVIGADQIVVVGHSAGGALAQRYALKYREHVDQLILVSSIRINNGVAVPIIWDRLLPALFVLGGWPPTEPQARDQWFTRLNETSSVSRLYDPSAADLLDDAGYLSFATWREVSRSLEGDDFSEQLRQLPVPTLVTYGAADSAYTGEATARDLCELIPECALARFERSGHWPFLEEPARFAQVVRDFLGSR
jgi:proline iminopeptidase